MPCYPVRYYFYSQWRNISLCSLLIGCGMVFPALLRGLPLPLVAPTVWVLYLGFSFSAFIVLLIKSAQYDIALVLARGFPLVGYWLPFVYKLYPSAVSVLIPFARDYLSESTVSSE